MEGAEVWITFMTDKIREWGVDSKVNKCSTDGQGLCTVEGKGVARVGISGTKDGFYEGGANYTFKQKSDDNRWEPWNPIVDVVLKKKRKPVPMYAKYTGPIKLPTTGAPIGYDLEQGDLVSPYGKGVISDFILELTSVERSFKDYECDLVVTFSNTRDGIKEYEPSNKYASYYAWPFEAPDDGYKTRLEKIRSFTPATGYISNIHRYTQYIFRVRTSADKYGKMTEAKYGKMPSDFDLSADGTIGFSYYFNPDGTRNLEFDPKRNLFQWSPEEESKHRLREP